MFDVNLSGASVGAPHAIVRNRFSVMFLVIALAGVVAAPTLQAERPERPAKAKAMARLGKEKKPEKYRGTLESLKSDGTTVQLTIADGTSLSVPANLVKVVDLRSGKREQATLTEVVVGTNVVVKIRKMADGSIRRVKIKLTD